MDAALEQAVWTRAGNACEYCCMPQALYRIPFQIDHIIAEQHGGPTTLDNLALACSQSVTSGRPLPPLSEARPTLRNRCAPQTCANSLILSRGANRAPSSRGRVSPDCGSGRGSLCG